MNEMFLSPSYSPPRISFVKEHRGGAPGRETSIVSSYNPEENRWIEGRVATNRAAGDPVPSDHPDLPRALAALGGEGAGDRSVTVHNELGYGSAATRRGLDTDY